MDSYGLSKVVNEKQLAASRGDLALIFMRFVSEMWLNHMNTPSSFPIILFTLKCDAGMPLLYRCTGPGTDCGFMFEKDGLGYQVFNAGNDHNGAIMPSKELAEKFFPNVPIKHELGEHEALFSNRKIREVLGFKEQHNWQKYLKWEKFKI